MYNLKITEFKTQSAEEANDFSVDFITEVHTSNDKPMIMCNSSVSHDFVDHATW